MALAAKVAIAGLLQLLSAELLDSGTTSWFILLGKSQVSRSNYIGGARVRDQDGAG